MYCIITWCVLQSCYRFLWCTRNKEINLYSENSRRIYRAGRMNCDTSGVLLLEELHVKDLIAVLEHHLHPRTTSGDTVHVKKYMPTVLDNSACFTLTSAYFSQSKSGLSKGRGRCPMMTFALPHWGVCWHWFTFCHSSNVMRDTRLEKSWGPWNQTLNGFSDGRQFSKRPLCPAHIVTYKERRWN